MKCRFCTNQLKYVFLDLGKSPPSNAYLTASQLDEPETSFPLKTCVCEKCFLVQMDEFAKHDTIFNNEYAYFSSYSKSWLAHAKSYTDLMTNKFDLSTNSQIIEIASNDGYLLQFFKEKNIPVLGIEPTANTAAVAKEKGIESIIDFFGASLAKTLVNKNIQADLLLGNNVLAHVPNINDFVSGMKILLKENGIITMEFPHLLKLIEHNQFDTVYHEHYSYLSLIAVKQIFEYHELELFDVEEIPTHGGSLRIYAKHTNDKTKKTEKNVRLILNKEVHFGISTISTYQNFQSKAEKVKSDFLEFLVTAKNEGKKVIAYGAAAKGNTLLNYSGIKSDLINFVVDASPHKQGKYMPGSHIPIFSEEKITEYKPDFIVILPWNIITEIEDQLSYVTEWGAKFVVAIPEIKIF